VAVQMSPYILAATLAYNTIYKDDEDALEKSLKFAG